MRCCRRHVPISRFKLILEQDAGHATGLILGSVQACSHLLIHLNIAQDMLSATDVESKKRGRSATVPRSDDQSDSLGDFFLADQRYEATIRIHDDVIVTRGEMLLCRRKVEGKVDPGRVLWRR